MGSHPSPSALDGAVADLWAQARPRALERVAVLEDAVAALIGGVLDGPAREAARAEAHKLAGALGTFGLSQGSVTARVLEGRFEAGPIQADAPAMAGEVLALRRAVESSAVGDAPGEAAGPRVSLAGLGSARAGALMRAAAGRSWRLRAVAAPPEPGEADVVLLDGGLPGIAGEVARQSAGGAAVAVLLEDAHADRVALVRRGAQRLLAASLPPARVVEELGELESGRRATGATVLAADDDPIVLALLGAALRKAGHELVACPDAAGFWPALEASRPDLVVLDVQMPGASGTELCRALRADPRWRVVPVLFLTATTRPQDVAELFAAGGDDYVPKPVDGAELTARIAGRLERTRQLRAAAAEDDRTGLLRRPEGAAALAELAPLARRLCRPLAVLALAQDGEEDAAEALAATAGRLRRALGPGDVAVRWSRRELVAGLLGVDAEEARARLDELLAAARADGAPLSAGLALLGRDGEDAGALAGAALAARREAAAAGGDRVLGADGSGAEVASVDVAVVEDDEVLAPLILHALETRGYRTRWIRDGDEAARQLGGERPGVRARLVLLDWDLPARDGLTVLRGLAADGVLAGTRVVMLTMRTSEREVLASLELGATEHVAKPFSVAVLMQRVQRVLER